MTKEDIISKFQAKKEEAVKLRASIDALKPIGQIDRYRYKYRNDEVDKLRMSLSLWQQQVKYMLQGVFGYNHKLVSDFSATISGNSPLVDEKIDISSQLDEGLVQLDALL